MAALEFAERHRAELTGAERDFVAAGRAAVDAEQRIAGTRHQNRRLRRLTGGIGVLLAVSLVAGALALREGARAQGQAQLAAVRELAAASAAALPRDPELAVLLALEAVETGRARGEPLRAAVEALHAAVVASRVVLTVPDVGGRVGWSPDGRVLATEGPEGSGLVDLRDPGTGTSLRPAPEHGADVNDVAFSPDGAMLATTGDDGAVRVWNPDTGERVLEVTGQGPAWSPTFSAAGDRLAAAWPQDGVVRVWQVPGGRLLREVPADAPPAGTVDVQLAPDGGHVAVASPEPGGAAVVHVDSGAVRYALGGASEAVTAVAWSPDGQRVATAGGDGTVRTLDAATGTVRHTVTAHSSAVVALDWSHDSRQLVSGGLDGTARVWDVTGSAAREVVTLTGATVAGGVVGVAFSPDGRHVLTGDDLRTAATVWDVGITGNAEVANLPGSAGTAFASAAFTPDGDVVAPTGGALVRWDLDPVRRLATLRPSDTPAPPDTLRGVAVSPDGARVAAVGSDDVARVWDLPRGRQAFAVPAASFLSDPAWSPDSRHLAIAREDRTLTVHGTSAAASRSLRAPTPDTGLRSPAFGYEGQTLAVVQVPAVATESAPRQVLLWSWRAGEAETWPGPTGETVTFSPDGTRLAAARLSGPATIWDVETRGLVTALEGHRAGVSDLAYAPDGARLATASADGTARVWDAETGLALLALPELPTEVGAVAFSPDGRRLLTAAADGVVRVWALDVDELVEIAHRNVTRGLTDAECREYLRARTCADREGTDR